MNELQGYDIEDLQVGMNATFAKMIAEADIVLFAGVSGGNNAMHIKAASNNPTFQYFETTKISSEFAVARFLSKAAS